MHRFDAYSLKSVAHLKAINIILHAFSDHSILAGNVLLCESVKQTHVCDGCWNWLKRNEVRPLCHQSTGCSVTFPGNLVLRQAKSLSKPKLMLAGQTQKAEVNLSVLCTDLEQVLDCMAAEHVLQNLHALQFVKGLHIGKASKYGAVKHAPAQLFETQCSADLNTPLGHASNKHMSAHIPLSPDLQPQNAVVNVKQARQEKSTPFCQARFEKAILQTLAWCLQKGVQQDQYVSFDASGLFQTNHMMPSSYLTSATKV